VLRCGTTEVAQKATYQALWFLSKQLSFTSACFRQNQVQGLTQPLRLWIEATDIGRLKLKEVYINEGNTEFEATGQWETRSKLIDEDLDAEVYVLTSEEDAEFQTQYYEIIDENTIRRLSDSAKRIPSQLAYELELQ